MTYDYRTANADLALAKRLAAKYARILGVKELPRIVIRNHLGAKWLGQLLWTMGDKPNVMELQKELFEDERSLERVVAHEMAHHVEMLELDNDPKALALIKMGIKPREHGDRWNELARKINGIVGDSNFVTKTSDQSYKEPTKTKPYVLLVAPIGSGPNLGYAIGVRLTPKMKKYVERYQTEYDGKLIPTTDPQWAHGPRIGNGFALAQTPERQKALRDLYEASPA